MKMEYRTADRASLEKIWQKNIDANPGDSRWVRWRDEYIEMNEGGRAQTFLILADGEPVGEGTLLFDPSCPAVHGITALADGKTTANINALRIEKQYENQGHISRLVKMMEAHAKDLGLTALTIGVEEKEHRNRAIYAHWGYTTPVHSETEDGELILYYSKEL